MATRRQSGGDSGPRRLPAKTPEGREKQLVADAMELAEKQIHAGTASSQVITHFLKLGSTEAELQKRKLEADIKMQEAKMEDMAAGRRVEALYTEAIAAIRAYQGQPPLEMPDDED